jgi:hypothetical protein
MAIRSATSLVELIDGTLVEVDVPESRATPLSSGFARKVDADLERIRPILARFITPIIDSIDNLPNSDRIKRAELEFGLSFEAEGFIYVTRSRSDGNITIKLIIE